MLPKKCAGQGEGLSSPTQGLHVLEGVPTVPFPLRSVLPALCPGPRLPLSVSPSSFGPSAAHHSSLSCSLSAYFLARSISLCPSRPTDTCSCFRLKLSRFHSMEPALSDSLPCTSCCPSLSHYCPESCHFWSLLPQMSLLPSFPQEPPLCVMCSPTRRRRQCSPIWEPLASSLWLLNT